jgi:hypothetical protein
MSSPFIAAAAPVSRATLFWSRILAPVSPLVAGRMRDFASCIHRRAAIEDMEGHLAELDISPLMVPPAGHRVEATDALVVFRRK